MSDRIEQLRAEQKERQDDRVRKYRGKLDVDGTTLLYDQLSQAEAALTEALDYIDEWLTGDDSMMFASMQQKLAEQERLLERARELVLSPQLMTDAKRVAFLSDLDAMSVPQGQETHPGPTRTDERAGPTGDLMHEQGRKHQQPWCLTHDAPMVCSADSTVSDDLLTAGDLLDQACVGGVCHCGGSHHNPCWLCSVRAFLRRTGLMDELHPPVHGTEADE